MWEEALQETNSLLCCQLHNLTHNFDMNNALYIKWTILSAKIISILVLLVIAALATLYFGPIANVQNTYNNSALTYEQSLTNIDKRKVLDNESINPVCKTKLLDHGYKTEKVVILYHGYTNCPAQYSVLGEQLYELGYNVYIPRTPFHGYQDIMTEDLKQLSADTLQEYTNNTVNEASGLGDSISVFGISGGANLALHATTHSNLVETGIIASPLISPQIVPAHMQRFSINTINTLPNQFIWWDEEVKDDRTEGPLYAYPRFSTKGVSAFLELTFHLTRDLDQTNLNNSEKTIHFLTLEEDPGVNGDIIMTYITEYSQTPGLNVTHYQFSKSTGLAHDTIDPNQPTANVDLVYPYILERV